MADPGTRITEDGNIRVAEAGDIRVTEQNYIDAALSESVIANDAILAGWSVECDLAESGASNDTPFPAWVAECIIDFRQRITEARDTRITEAGDIRIAEQFNPESALTSDDSLALWVAGCPVAESGLSNDSTLGGFFIQASLSESVNSSDAVSVVAIRTYAWLEIEGNETFAIGDILRIKTGEPGALGNDEWLEVSNIAFAPKYGVIRDKGSDYAADANPAWTKGAAVVNYGQAGDGGIYMTASESNAPYMSVFTHAGSPWGIINTRLRIGNLNGFLNYTSDLYGIAIGESGKSLKYDPTNGLRISGNIDASTITGGSITGAIIKTATSGRMVQIDSGGIKLIAGSVTGKYGTNFKYGNGTQYGDGFLAYFYNIGDGMPFYVNSEQTIADMHLYNRTNNPSGAAEIGDLCVVGGKHSICTIAGTPGTWVICGDQTA